MLDPTLDTLVTDYLVAEMLQPGRLPETLSSLWSPRAEKSAQVEDRVAALRSEVTGAEEKPERFYHKLEEGVTGLDEILNGPLVALKSSASSAKKPARRPSSLTPVLAGLYGSGAPTGNRTPV